MRDTEKLQIRENIDALDDRLVRVSLHGLSKTYPRLGVWKITHLRGYPPERSNGMPLNGHLSSKTSNGLH